MMDTDLGGSITVPADVQSVLDAYAAGFDDFDAEAVAECFAYPATLWQGGRGNVFDDEEDLIENVEALLDIFEREEIVHSTFRIEDAAFGQDSGAALLSWRQERADGEAALEFTCRYLFIRDGEDGAWRIATTVTD
ncbi:DUF4440 domain-containing protein [Aureimonas frigidaquae]|uniref:SnoaL-like domain-containing protein n=1 Tax=Aureimonas frigidaquae TaxID=424757 RepID=A0A0P0Z0R8_9HYPH|nr:DUF4440 domain-containing protein [Aureimonas frigidaquae]BAT27503.1 hypothetical protein [Aureimonas frigidaquae]